MRNSPRVIAALASLGALAVIYSVWPIWRALFMLELSPNEAWNAYHADHVLAGRPLYPQPDSLITNNYPPLSFYFIAALSRLSSMDPAYVGRALSLLGIGITGLAIADCVRQLGGSRLAAGVAGLWFVATSARFFEDYVGVNDPHIVGLAITVTGLAWFLRRQAQGRAPEPAILLMAIAGFHKQTLVATPVAALLWIAVNDWRAGLRATLVGSGVALAGLLVCAGLYGYAFLHQLLFYPREISIAWAFANLGQLQFIAPALIIWAIWARYQRQAPAARFSALYIAAGLCTYFLLKLGKPGGINAQLELAAATAIGLGLAFHGTIATPFAQRRGVEASRLTIVGILIARLLLSNHIEPYLVIASSDYRRQFAAHVDITRREVERVAGIAGPAYCTVTMVCRWAGKAFLFDPYAADLVVATKRMSLAELQARMAAQRIGYVVVDSRTTARSLERTLLSFIR
jgi:hypothetical protein